MGLAIIIEFNVGTAGIDRVGGPRISFTSDTWARTCANLDIRSFDTTSPWSPCIGLQANILKHSLNNYVHVR